MKKKLIFLFGWLFLSAFAVQLYAQQLQPLPIDPNVKYGKLDNGLTYYIRHNEQPAQRADFYIAQRVGSILEEDSQQGLAHFLEHMAFNGTKNFPGKSMIDYLETIGVRFGENLNAYTGFDETVYNISDAPVTRPGIVDSCLLILHDWSNAILLEGDEIDKERGVIHEEWRTGGGAEMRLWEQLFPFIYAGSRYANRFPIGKMEVVDNFQHDALRNYYKKWYRPDLQAIIVVGDIDVDAVEAKIKTIFADIPKPEDPAPRIMYPVPDNDMPIVAIAKDKEATHTIIRIYYKHDQLPLDLKATPAGLVMNYIRQATALMMQNRFKEIAQKPNAPFLQAAGSDGYFMIAKTKDAWIVSALAKEGTADSALAALVRETQRLKQHGFTQSEYDRARIEILNWYESAYKEREKQKNSFYTSEYVDHFTNGGYIPGIEVEYTLLSQVAPDIPVEQVNKYIQDMIGEKNIVLTLYGPDKEEIIYPTQEELLRTFMKAGREEVAPYEEKISDEPLVEKLPAPGKIVSSKEIQAFGATELVLSNGIKVYLKPTNFKKDQILMTATSPGGTTLLGDGDISNAKLMNSLINLGGVGNFSEIDLGKRLAGIRVSAYPSIGPDYEKMDASATPKDLETMFQLVYLYFTAPRIDQNAYTSFLERKTNQLKNQSQDPMTSLADTLNSLMYQGDPRNTRLKLSDLGQVDYQRVMDLYKERFGDASDFVFTFVGNINMDTIKPYLEQYLATLPVLDRKDPKGNESVVTPIAPGAITKHFTRTMQTPKATVINIYSGKLDYTLENRMLLNALQQILNIVYMETVREEEGGTYGVGVYGQVASFPEGKLVFQTYFDTDPAKWKKLNGIVRNELRRIAEVGPRAADFNKTKENMLKKFDEDTQENSYWQGVIDDYAFYGIDRYSSYKKNLEAMTPKQIQKLAADILSQGNVIEVVMTSDPIE